MDADESRGLARTLLFPNRVVRAKVLTTIGDSIFLTKAMCFWESASCSAKDRSFSFTLAQGFYTGFLHHIYIHQPISACSRALEICSCWP